jgi:hypothetical protein
LLGFIWIYLAESGLFNELQAKKLKNFAPALGLYATSVSAAARRSTRVPSTPIAIVLAQILDFRKKLSMCGNGGDHPADRSREGRQFHSLSDFKPLT